MSFADTRFLDAPGLMAAAIRNHDWSANPLGPPVGWPDVLKTTVALMLGSHFPKSIVWGPDLITIHNDAFLPILGNKPPALGRPFSDVWREAWDGIRPIADAAFAGTPTFIEDFPLVVERGGGPEQAYFTFCYSPIRDRTGRVFGMLDTVTETTATVVANRRLAFLDELGRSIVDARDPDEVMAITTRSVAEHLDISNCAYADMGANEDGFTIRGDFPRKGVSTTVGHYSLVAFGVLAVEKLRAGEPLVIEDMRQIATDEAATFRAIGIEAIVCMPLVKNDRLTALMAVHDSRPRTWSEAELVLVRDVTERSWAHVERVRAESELAALAGDLERRVEERTAALREAEDALRQSQKMEAVGQLTGGVAHDFNNLLTIIRSSVDFLRRPELSDERRARYLGAVSDTVDRAAKLTGQLLAFARRQALKPETFEVGERLRAVVEMIGTVTGSRILTIVDIPTESCHVHLDISQFETAIINVAVNARDAMEGEGTLTLRLECGVPKPAVRGHAPADGPFAVVSVSDTGAGIAPQHLDRIFEPFFTTKEVGKGTGLGLSQVFGFAKQSGGDVDVRSEVGVGTTFAMYLPVVEALGVEADDDGEAPDQGVDGAGRRVLVVEDNVDVGRFSTQILEDLGYSTAWAANAEEALAKLGEDGGGYDLVFSDVVMPGMGGVALAEELRHRLPDLPVILTSGYSHVLAEQADHGFELINKPYSAEEISRVFRKVVSARRGPRRRRK